MERSTASVKSGCRVFAVSCFTGKDLKKSKLKMFEIAFRARQLGGDLGRSALVCFLTGSDANGPLVDQLRQDVADLWGAPNTPRVFGLDDVMEWTQTADGKGPCSLREWLES